MGQVSRAFRLVLSLGSVALVSGTTSASSYRETEVGYYGTPSFGYQASLAPRSTLSGTPLRASGVQATTWLLYPNACLDRAAGTWSPKTAWVADSLDTYAVGTRGGYGAEDLSLDERLWHVVDIATPATQRPSILSGNRSIWCGKYDPAWVVEVGYPNHTYQILYIDTGAHAADYTLTLSMCISSELFYEGMYLVGGGNADVDPLANNRPLIDAAISNASGTGQSSLVAWTGTILPTTPGARFGDTRSGIWQVDGMVTGDPIPFTVSIQIRGEHRALYFVFLSDDVFSSEDGLWPYGTGPVLDNIGTSDNGLIFDEGTPPVGTDPVLPQGAGQPIQGTFGTPGYIAARVAAGAGEMWQIQDGSASPSSDFCAVVKSAASNRLFFGDDAGTKRPVPYEDAALVSCTLPVPVGTASLMAWWSVYADLPIFGGYSARGEYRFFKNAAWSSWRHMAPARAVQAGSSYSWSTEEGNLAEATQADSVQLRWVLDCGSISTSAGCTQQTIGVLFDDFRLQLSTGVPPPVISVFPGNVAQSTFIDGTVNGENCGTTPCWIGNRGSALPGAMGLHDNVNAPLGDSLVISILSGLRQNGMGVNWHRGFDLKADSGLAIAHTYQGRNANADAPRMIYRLFDPATKTWSPWDSTELDANLVQVKPNDTLVVDSEFRADWPPRDKAGLSLPGGFTINGIGAYNGLAFLPRGTRLQYYFKAVDINGNVTYRFDPGRPALERRDLPALPGSFNTAPDILEFDVLPGSYATGSAGSLLAGQTTTPVLVYDNAYTKWSFGKDPLAEALEGLGVRWDTYRVLPELDEESHGLGGSIGTFRDRSTTPSRGSWSLADSLASWYRIIIIGDHVDAWAPLNLDDLHVLRDWYRLATPGANGGDRCIFVAGDNFFNFESGDPLGVTVEVFGVAAATDTWNGTASVLYPTVTDNFSGQTYPVDGGCPGPNRFDALMGTTDAQNVAFYPTFAGVTDVAAIATMSEKDAVTDNDRSKALGYAFSIQFVRKAGIPTSAANYVHSGVAERMQILYKFLASCRGPRSGSPADTGKCWPCPTDANLTGNWAALSGFQTGTYGPLYPIQDPLAATGVREEPATVAPLYINTLAQNRPNPFNPRTLIRYSLADAGQVQVRIFDVAGRLVRTLVDAKQGAGWHEVPWDGRNNQGTQTASGMYFYRITYPDGGTSAKKMAILR